MNTKLLVAQKMASKLCLKCQPATATHLVEINRVATAATAVLFLRPECLLQLLIAVQLLLQTWPFSNAENL